MLKVIRGGLSPFITLASIRRRRIFNEQQMRLLAGLFESGRVDIVFGGHVHNYQRSFPLRFVANKGKDDKLFATRTKFRAAGRSTRFSTVRPIRGLTG